MGSNQKSSRESIRARDRPPRVKQRRPRWIWGRGRIVAAACHTFTGAIQYHLLHTRYGMPSGVYLIRHLTGGGGGGGGPPGPNPGGPGGPQPGGPGGPQPGPGPGPGGGGGWAATAAGRIL